MSSSDAEVVRITTGTGLRSGSDLICSRILASVIFRQVEVEQNQVDSGRIRILAAPVKEVQRLLPVTDHVQPIVELVVLESLARHELVARIFLDQQDLDGLGRGYKRIPSARVWRARRLACRSCGPGLAPGLAAGQVKQLRFPGTDGADTDVAMLPDKLPVGGATAPSPPGAAAG
jgi:hypothetical protein